MTFEIETGGRARKVEVRRLAHGWMVATDGRESFVSVTGIGGRWSLLVAPAEAAQDVASGFSRPREDVASGSSRTVAFKSYELVVEPLSPGQLRVTVNGRAIAVTLSGLSGARGSRGHRGGIRAPDGAKQVVAPMPGRVVKVLVQPGETVTTGQGLVVVEAMKMENELRAPAAGTVRAVHVAEGAAVEANTVLIEIE